MRHSSDDSVIPSPGSTRASGAALTPATGNTPHAPADGELVAAFLAGDQDAFDALYARHADSVRKACRRRLRDYAAAEDATQETFIRVLRALPQLSEPDRLGGYITVTARSVCIDAIRRRKAAREVLHARDTDERGTMLLSSTPASLDQDVETRLVAQQLLDAARPTDALLLRAHHRDGVPVEELARALGSTPGSIAVRLHRARQRALRFAEAHSLRGVLWPALWRLRRRGSCLGLGSGYSGVALPALMTTLGVVGLMLVLSIPPAADAEDAFRIREEPLHETQNGPSKGIWNDAQDPVENDTARERARRAQRRNPRGGAVAAHPARGGNKAPDTPAPLEEVGVHVPVTGTRIEQRRPAGRPDHRIGASIDLRPIREDPVDAGAEVYDEPQTRALQEVACTAANAGRPVTFCDADDER